MNGEVNEEVGSFLLRWGGGKNEGLVVALFICPL